MKKILTAACSILAISIVLVSCDTIKNLPTNTTGGLFSLNGTWRLNATTDNKALQGSTITVYPVVGNGTIKTLENNTYCVKEGEQIWKSVKSNNAGGFTFSTLVSACNGSIVYRDANLTVINNDEVTVTTRTASGTELIQQWQRVTSK